MEDNKYEIEKLKSELLKVEKSRKVSSIISNIGWVLCVVGCILSIVINKDFYLYISISMILLGLLTGIIFIFRSFDESKKSTDIVNKIFKITGWNDI